MSGLSLFYYPQALFYAGSFEAKGAPKRGAYSSVFRINSGRPTARDPTTI
jgi:hypothetical protein